MKSAGIRNDLFSRRVHSRQSRAFSLIELLTVIFIISLLIAILIPSLHSARNAAKKTSSKATLAGIKVALEAFKTDHERDFRATNGYPPSFSHPPIGNWFTAVHSQEGRFPFLEGRPRVNGAHWLPAMLIGPDSQGYIPSKNVPATPAELKNQPYKWYKHDASSTTIERSTLYLDSAALRLVPNKDLPGFKGDTTMVDWGDDQSNPNDSSMRQLPVIADAFGQAIIYYAANAFGKTNNLIERVRNPNNDYGSVGPPYYFHQDNWFFTGDAENQKKGWSFGGSNEHPLARSGDEVNGEPVFEAQDSAQRPHKTFAGYIVDRAALTAAQGTSDSLRNIPRKPVNSDSYLLISPGVDGLYGSRDDVSNLPEIIDPQ